MTNILFIKLNFSFDVKSGALKSDSELGWYVFYTTMNKHMFMLGASYNLALKAPLKKRITNIFLAMTAPMESV